jgi:hypothetical protein
MAQEIIIYFPKQSITPLSKHMLDWEVNTMESITNTQNIQEVEESDSDVKYMTVGNTTYEVVYKYVGKQSILDIIKAGIRRDIESGNY